MPLAFDEVVDLLDESVILIDLEGRVTAWNNVAERIFGWPRERAVGRFAHELFGGRTPLTLATLEARAALNGWKGEILRKSARGDDVLFNARWTVRRSSTGDPIDVIEIGRDLGSLLETERETRNVEYRYRNLFQAMATSFWELGFRDVGDMLRALIQSGVTDLRGHFAAHPEFVRDAMAATNVVDVNDKTLELFGPGSRDAFIGGSVAPYWPRKSWDVYAESLIAAVEKRPTFSAETTMTALDGREIETVFTVCWPRENRAAGTFLVGFLDITDRKRAEAKLQRMQADLAHASRVSVLGELTASIAHEVNQPLATIAINGAAALRRLGRGGAQAEEEEARALTAQMIADAQRAGDIIERIKATAARRAPEPTRLSLNEVVDEAARFLKHEMQAQGVDLRLDLASGLPSLLADRTQIQQVIVNLALNAIQAMSQADGGPRELVIRTRLERLGALMLCVEDSGPGIAPGALERVFDPFFTTKAGGIGIGLAICRSIVEAVGGEIRAENNPAGRGARFHFVAPASAPSSEG